MKQCQALLVCQGNNNEMAPRGKRCEAATEPGDARFCWTHRKACLLYTSDAADD